MRDSRWYRPCPGDADQKQWFHRTALGRLRNLAIELGPDNIRVNAVLPGAVEGPRIQRVIADKAASLGISHEEMEKRIVSKSSLGRMVTAEDISNTILFICSDAGRNVSGQALAVDGDAQYLV